MMLNASENAVQGPHKFFFADEIAIVRPRDSGVVPDPFDCIEFW
jgi:acetyl-CoA acetyltransferase